MASVQDPTEQAIPQEADPASKPLQDAVGLLAILQKAAASGQLWSFLGNGVCLPYSRILHGSLQSSALLQQLLEKHDIAFKLGSIVSSALQLLKPQQIVSTCNDGDDDEACTQAGTEALLVLCSCLCDCCMFAVRHQSDLVAQVAGNLLPKDARTRGMLIPALASAMSAVSAALQRPTQPNNTPCILFKLSSGLFALWQAVLQLGGTPLQLFTLDLAVLPASSLALTVLNSQPPDSQQHTAINNASGSGRLGEAEAGGQRSGAAVDALRVAHALGICISAVSQAAVEVPGKWGQQGMVVSAAAAPFLRTEQLLQLLLINLAAVAAALHTDQKGLLRTQAAGAAPSSSSGSRSDTYVMQGSVRVPEYHLEFSLPAFCTFLQPELESQLMPSWLTSSRAVEAAVTAAFAALSYQRPARGLQRVPIDDLRGAADSSSIGRGAAAQPAALVRLLCEVAVLRPKETLTWCLGSIRVAWKQGAAACCTAGVPEGMPENSMAAELLDRNLHYSATMAEDLAPPVLLLLVPAVLRALQRPATDDSCGPSSRGLPPNEEADLLDGLGNCLQVLLASDGEQALLPVFSQAPLLVCTALQAMLRSLHKIQDQGITKLQTWAFQLSNLPLRQHAELAVALAAGGSSGEELLCQLSGLLITSLKCAAAVKPNPKQGSRWDAMRTAMTVAQAGMAILDGVLHQAALDAVKHSSSSKGSSSSKVNLLSRMVSSNDSSNRGPAAASGNSSNSSSISASTHAQPCLVALVARSLFVLGQLISQMHANPAAAGSVGAGHSAINHPFPHLIGGRPTEACQVPETCIAAVEWLWDQLAAVPAVAADGLKQLQEQQSHLLQGLAQAQQACSKQGAAAAREQYNGRGCGANALQVVSEALDEGLVAQLLEVAATVGAQLPSALGCHNLGCCNLKALSEHCCASKACPKCKGPRFCGKTCNEAQREQHTPVCRQLRACRGSGSGRIG